MSSLALLSVPFGTQALAGLQIVHCPSDQLPRMVLTISDTMHAKDERRRVRLLPR